MNALPENIGNSPLRKWIRDHIEYPHKDWCLIWPFGSKRAGYAAVLVGGKMLSVHRVICELIHGPAPEGYVAAHSCGRGHEACVNPHHVSWKTNSANQFDRTDRGIRSKLNQAKADEIRALTGKESVQITAKRYGVSESAVRQVQTGKTWGAIRSRNADLTPEQVRYVFEMKGHKSQAELARELGVNHAVIWRIHHGHSYRHALPSHPTGQET